MPPISRPFPKGGIVILLNYNDYDPPHLHVKYQNDFGSYRIEIRTRAWMKSDKQLSAVLQRMVEDWVQAREHALLQEWENAQQHRPVHIVE